MCGAAQAGLPCSEALQGSLCDIFGQASESAALSPFMCTRHTGKQRAGYDCSPCFDQLLQGGLDVGMFHSDCNGWIACVTVEYCRHCRQHTVVRQGWPVLQHRGRRPALSRVQHGSCCTQLVLGVGCRWSRLARTIAFCSQLFSRFRRAWGRQEASNRDMHCPCT